MQTASSGLRDMQRVPVGFGIDRDARDAHRVERADDAAGDGAAVRDQDLSKHAVISAPPASQISTCDRASGCRRCRDC